MPQQTHLDFLRAKADGRKLSMATCYDATFARLIAHSPIDGILVGDSAAMVTHGHANTLQATVDMLRVHTAAVVRAAPERFVTTDMPFLSCRKGLAPAMEAAHALMAAGAHALKVEGVDGHQEIIRHIVQSGIPVMGHIGMQPQSVQAYGGFKPQGRDEDGAATIRRQASELEALGVFSVVLECIPAPLAAELTAALRIPTIGIGAGPGCDGQILVLQDLLGLNSSFRPRFARAFCDGEKLVLDALAAFDGAIKDGTFPTSEESFR